MESVRFSALEVMQFLRKRRSLLGERNLRISEWVEDYIFRCVQEGAPVTLLTQWCISKDLEVRYRLGGNQFTPTRKERLLFAKELPEIFAVFKRNGVRAEWWITFNRSYLASGRISAQLESEYTQMIESLAEPLLGEGWLLLLNWEEDVLKGRPKPNPQVLSSPENFVGGRALEREIERHGKWAREDAGIVQTEAELRRDVLFQIACEAEEGRLLSSTNLIGGEFILVPLEAPERYDFFKFLVPDFKERLASVLPLYPWRLQK